jgi:Erv1 / Alr family
MKIPPSVWGPLFWHTIHITAIGYPNSPTYAEKRAAKEFYESLALLIPCSVCREHYQTHLQKMPLAPHLDRRDDLFKWTVQLHNEVNVLLGKPRVLEAEALHFYKRLGARGKSPVIQRETLDELDFRSMVKGACLGAGLVFTVGALLWISSKNGE